MTDDLHLLASAYLDGDVTADERARAEADPEVMDLVDRMARMRSVIADVTPAARSVRETAIAAALAEYPISMPTPRNASWSRRDGLPASALGMAAGLVAIGLLGVVVLQSRSGDDELTGVADEASIAVSEAPAVPGETDRATAEAAVADTADAKEPAEEPVAAEMTASEDLAPDAEAGSTANQMAVTAGERPILVPGQVLTTPEELGSYGTGLLEQLRAGTLPPTPNTRCPFPDVLGSAVFLVDGVDTPVLVGVDETLGVVTAYVAETCEVLMGGPLYQP